MRDFIAMNNFLTFWHYLQHQIYSLMVFSFSFSDCHCCVNQIENEAISFALHCISRSDKKEYTYLLLNDHIDVDFNWIRWDEMKSILIYQIQFIKNQFPFLSMFRFNWLVSPESSAIARNRSHSSILWRRNVKIWTNLFFFKARPNAFIFQFQLLLVHTHNDDIIIGTINYHKIRHLVTALLLPKIGQHLNRISISRCASLLNLYSVFCNLIPEMLHILAQFCCYSHNKFCLCRLYSINKLFCVAKVRKQKKKITPNECQRCKVFHLPNQIKSYGPTVKSAQVLMITCCCIWLLLTRRACHYFELWQQQQHHHSTIVKCDVYFTANPAFSIRSHSRCIHNSNRC